MDKAIQRARRQTIGDLLSKTAFRYPDKIALTFGERALTYKALDLLVTQTAYGLQQAGIYKNDYLAILSKNSMDFVIVTFAVARMGAVIVPINYMLKQNDIAYILEHSEVKGVFASEEYIKMIDSSLALTELSVTKKYILDSEVENMTNWHSLKSVQANQENAVVDVEIQDEDVAQILYTSGTESAPKGVMLSHRSIINEAVSCIVDGQMAPSDKLVHALPFYHSAQLNVFLVPSIYVGSSGTILGQASPDIIMKTIEDNQSNQLFAPPTVWIAMLRHPSFEKYNLDSLEKCYYGAAIMPREILKELSEKLPNARFWNFYGQTEVAPLATALQPEDQLRKLGSAGIASLNVETKIFDEDDNEVPRGEVGEIVHRTPHAMIGYLKNPEKTKEAFKNGWFHSGDLGVMDEEGYITVVDRKKDMIISGGENVSSREVEETIYLLDEVAEVAVIGLPDDYWIEAVSAVIVLKEGATLEAEFVKEFCKGEMNAFKAPKRIFFANSLPKNPSGKVLKKDLREMYQ